MVKAGDSPLTLNLLNDGDLAPVWGVSGNLEGLTVKSIASLLTGILVVLEKARSAALETALLLLSLNSRCLLRLL